MQNLRAHADLAEAPETATHSIGGSFGGGVRTDGVTDPSDTACTPFDSSSLAQR